MKLNLFSNFVAIEVLGFVGLLICFLGNSLFTMASPSDITKSISRFSTEIYNKATEGQSSNVIISPFSIHMALSLAYMGAEGQTASEMKRGLNLIGTKDETANQIRQLIDPIQNSTMLKVANKVYVMQNYRINKNFNTIAKEKFHSEAQSLNFANSVESAQTINSWVEEKTNGKIKNLIPSDALGSDTRMVLVNAIYFKGFWQHQFKKQRTDKAQFFTSETDSVEVDMMHIKEYFRYGEFADLDAKGIDLPYKDSDMSMFVILPNKRTGLAKLETDLQNRDILELSKFMHRTEVEVSLPRFKIEFEISLVNTLKKMGMTNMFYNSADFSGLLDSDEPLKISDVIHKAFIDVNEEGSEAAAATGIVFVTLSASIGPRFVFEADHSFTFVLKKNKDILFMGRFTR